MTENPQTPQQTEADDEISLLDLLQTVAENIKLLVLGPLAVGVTALGISFLVPPTFTAQTVVLPPQQQQSAATAMLQSLGSLGGLAGAATGLKNPNDQYVALLKSRAVEHKLVERFSLINHYEAELRDDAVKTLEGKTRVTSGKDGLITIEFDDTDPAFAAQVANAYVEELSQLMGRLAVTEAQQRRAFFEKQLNQTKNNLTRAEQALQASGVNAAALKSNPQAAVGVVAQLQAQITAQEIKIASMRGYLQESSPQFKQSLTELAALRAQLAKAEHSQAPTQAPGQADYVARYRDFTYHETLFDLFAKQFELAKVDESREGAVIQVVDVALPPERKSKPKKALIAVLATMASGFALLLFVFVRQAVRNAKAQPETAAKLAVIQKALSFSRTRA
jgi:uncharacterized protein involved in exopolysaccharide biosynthesis